MVPQRRNWTEESILKGMIQKTDTALTIGWNGRRVTTADVWTALLGAAAEKQSLSGLTRTAVGAPHANSVMHILRAQEWWTLADVERGLNGLLQATAPALGLGPLKLAFDLHEQPYYGDKEGDMVRGGERKAGTSRFFTYATAYVNRPDRRVTLAITPVYPDDTMVAIVARLIARLEPLDLHVGMVLLDRGFFSADVIQLLQTIGLAFVLPMRQTGNATKGIGNARLFTWEVSGWSRHQMKASDGQVVGFDVAVVVVRDRKKKAFKSIPLACSGMNGRIPPAVLDHYSGRFGIETSYREGLTCRIPTTSRDPVYRLLRVGLSLALANWWRCVRRALGEPCTGRNGVRLHPKFLPFQQFKGWICHAVRQQWPLQPPEPLVIWRERSPQRRRPRFQLRRRRRAA